MRYLVFLVLLVGCSKNYEPPCHSGVALKDPVMGVPTYSCDYRSKSVKLSDGSVLCVCPEDVTKLTK